MPSKKMHCPDCGDTVLHELVETRGSGWDEPRFVIDRHWRCEDGHVRDA